MVPMALFSLLSSALRLSSLRQALLQAIRSPPQASYVLHTRSTQLPLGCPSSFLAMSPPAAHKISSSNHKLYHEALRLSKLYVYLSLGYGTLLLGAALHLAGLPIGRLLGVQDAPMAKPQDEGTSAGVEGWVQSGALSLGTAGVMGLLIGSLVSVLSVAAERFEVFRI